MALLAWAVSVSIELNVKTMWNDQYELLGTTTLLRVKEIPGYDTMSLSLY
jgi:hypothetical protein